MTASDDADTRMQRFLDRYGCGDLPLEDLTVALTHRSYAYEANCPVDNERMEFLGDALISAVTSEALFDSDPSADEGAMSKRRSRLISRAVLGRRAIDMGIGDIILLGRGERETGGARRRSILGSALEAIVAAIYLRLGFDRTRMFIIEHVLASLSDGMGGEKLSEDYKSALQEWSQQRLHLVPVYQLIDETGPDHDKSFTVEVHVDGQLLGRGTGRRIKSAENDAARLALLLVQERPEMFGTT